MRSAPARRSLLSESSTLARATIVMSERSSRAVRVMKMFSASESTQAMTPAARMIPAARSVSSSDGEPSMNGTPIASAYSRVSAGLLSMTTKRPPAACRSRAACCPTRPKPQIRMWSLSESIFFSTLLSSSRPERWPETKNSVTVTSA